MAATSSTTAPVATSARLRPCMVRIRASGTGASRAGSPGLVVAPRGPPRAADIVMPGRAIGVRRAGQVGQVVLLPEVALLLRQRLGHRVVQPGVPFRRHGGRLLGAGEDHPAAGAVVDRLRLSALEIEIAEAVTADLAAGERGGEAQQGGHEAGNAPRGTIVPRTIARRVLRRKAATRSSLVTRRYPQDVACPEVNFP